MLKVVVIGYGSMFTNLIAGSLDAGCEVVGVFRKESLKYNKFIKKIYDILNPSVELSYIKSYNLHEISARSVNSKNFKKELLKLNPDIILVGSWGEKISKEIYSIPKIASINAHPSLLPKYRGPNPYFWVIRNCEKASGVSLHLIDDNFDTGSILAQEEVKIFSNDTGETLKQRTVLVARAVVCELLKDLQEDIIIPLKQEESISSYYSHPKDLGLCFQLTSKEIIALINASYPWCKNYFYHKNTCFVVEHQNIEIVENKTFYKKSGTIVDINLKTKTISILCKDNKIIKLKIDLYNKYDKFFTKNYMRQEMRIGQII